MRRLALIPLGLVLGCGLAAQRAEPGIVEALSPMPGETDVPLDTAIVVRLSQPAASPAEEAIALVGPDGVPRPGKVTLLDPFTVVFQPDDPLAPDTTHQVCLTHLSTQSGARVRSFRPAADEPTVLPLADGCYTFETGPALRLLRVLAQPEERRIDLYFSRECALDTLEGIRILTQDGQDIEHRLRYAPSLHRVTLYVGVSSGAHPSFILEVPDTVSAPDGTRIETPIRTEVSLDSQSPSE